MIKRQCTCGCGRPAPIATRSSPKRGTVVGEPMRFICGHATRKCPETMEGFLAKLSVPDEPDGCREWTGGTRDGYGQVRWHGRDRSTHVVAWELRHGPVPAGMQVLHKCDNRPCCHWDHLFLGSIGDNMADMVAKGRQAKGERNGRAKLREDDIGPIRTLAETLTKSDIATMYGVHPSTVYCVLTGKTWRHVTAGESG